MAKLPYKRIQRTRPRTPEEVVRDAEVREKIAQDPSWIPTGLTMKDFFALRSVMADLKEARKAQGLTLAEVSRRSGLASSVLCRLESGRQWNPTLHTLARYAKAVGKRLSLTLEEAAEPAARK
jgi:DNA-binding phage protein